MRRTFERCVSWRFLDSLSSDRGSGVTFKMNDDEEDLQNLRLQIKFRHFCGNNNLFGG